VEIERISDARPWRVEKCSQERSRGYLCIWIRNVCRLSYSRQRRSVYSVFKEGTRAKMRSELRATMALPTGVKRPRLAVKTVRSRILMY
jgi:hypothetical protein